ncbi:MAG: hypothetical protein AAGA65_06155 [Actinomycetota bacterium]
MSPNLLATPVSDPTKLAEFSTLSHVTIIGAMVIVPIYLFATYHAAGADRRKSLLLTLAVIIYSVVMTAFVVEWQDGFDSPYVVPVVMLTSLAIPPLLVLRWPDYFVPEQIGLDWLVGVQAFRVIGGLYLFEYGRGNVGPEFAYWAGIGDVVTGIAASGVLLFYWTTKRMPYRAVYATILFGLADFAWAYGIGVLSFETPLQVFSRDDLHATNRFPIAMIPFLLAPIAMGFMVMTLLALRRVPADAPSIGSRPGGDAAPPIAVDPR